MTQVNQRVIDAAYGFTIDVNGEVHGLVAGDMGYEPTGIKIDGDTLEIWSLGVKEWAAKHKMEADGNAVDTGITADAARFRWLLNGNGYFMEEESLCGHGPCDDQEQDDCRAAIDKAMLEDS